MRAVTRLVTVVRNGGTRAKASSAITRIAPSASRTMRMNPPITFGAPTRFGRQPASRVRTPKRRLKNRRYQGSRTAIASSRELPQRRQKCRIGSLPSPQLPQMRSPGRRRVGGSIVRGACRGRAIVGATEVGRRDIGSSDCGVGAADPGALGAIGAPTPARTGSGAATVSAALGGAGVDATGEEVVGGVGAGGRVIEGAADMIGTARTEVGAGAAG